MTSITINHRKTAPAKLHAETATTLYDKARHALVAAVSVDEAKGIRDKALAMKVYAEQAFDAPIKNDYPQVAPDVFDYLNPGRRRRAMTAPRTSEQQEDGTWIKQKSVASCARWSRNAFSETARGPATTRR